MEREEILKKAILKAIENGFKYEKEFEVTNIDEDEFVSATIRTDEGLMDVLYHINGIIFDHEFAKAFWGELQATKCCGSGSYIVQHVEYCNECEHKVIEYIDEWKHHIQKLATSTDRLEYISNFI
jgi:hypothetical protein